ncbi:MAG: MMPL family transporter, partial [Myxococcales bacterium]|nr:MMPL family transporter [Myxococcales bacterium]
QEETDEGLRQLAAMAGVLEARLKGEDARRALIELVGDKIEAQKGIDEFGYFTGWSEPHHLIALFPELPSGEVEDVAPFVHDIRDALDRVRSELDLDAEDVTVRVTGLPVFATDELALVRQGIIESGIVTGLAIFLLQLFAFRSVRVALFVQLPLVFGIVTTVGFVGLTYGRLTIITSSFIAILLGLGIDFSIHLVTRANEIRRERECSASEGIVESMRLAGPGVAAGALTTVIAFLTTTTTEFTAFAELGLITAFGLVAMMVAAFTILPALMGMGWGGAKYREAKIPGLHLLTRVVSRAPRVIVALGVIGAIVGALLFPTVRFNARYFDFLPRNSDAAIALDSLERDGAMSPTFACLSAETFDEARARVEALREQPTVADVQSVTDILPPLDEPRLRSLRAGMQKLGRAPDFAKLRERERSAAALAGAIDKVVSMLDEVQFELKTNDRPFA